MQSILIIFLVPVSDQFLAVGKADDLTVASQLELSEPNEKSFPKQILAKHKIGKREERETAYKQYKKKNADKMAELSETKALWTFNRTF